MNLVFLYGRPVRRDIISQCQRYLDNISKILADATLLKTSHMDAEYKEQHVRVCALFGFLLFCSVACDPGSLSIISFYTSELATDLSSPNIEGIYESQVRASYS